MRTAVLAERYYAATAGLCTCADEGEGSSDRREVRATCDDKDKKVGKVGYEINFNRYFYRYTPPRPLEEIEADIKGIEKDVLDMLREVAG